MKLYGFITLQALKYWVVTNFFIFFILFQSFWTWSRSKKSVCYASRVEGLTGGFLVTTPKKMADIFLVFPGFDGLHLLHISSFHTFVSFWGYRMSHTFDLVDGKGKETGHTSVLLKQKNTWKTTVVFPGFVAQLLFCVLGREMPLSIPTDGRMWRRFSFRLLFGRWISWQGWPNCQKWWEKWTQIFRTTPQIVCCLHRIYPICIHE